MPCEIEERKGSVVFTRYAKPPLKKCRWCQHLCTKLCDFVISPPEQVTHRRTCDAPMCDAHAKSVGPNLDYCPDHANG